MIRSNQKVVVERTVCTCDRCGCNITSEDHPVEWHERFAIRFRAGYGSIFGDGNCVEGDFCQRCIEQTLGKYLRIRSGDPFGQEQKAEGDPERIYQPYQLDRVEQAAGCAGSGCCVRLPDGDVALDRHDPVEADHVELDHVAPSVEHIAQPAAIAEADVMAH